MMTMTMVMLMMMVMLIWCWCQPGVVWRGAVPELTRLPLVHLEPLIVWKLTNRCHHDLLIIFQIFSSLLDRRQKFYFLPFPNINSPLVVPRGCELACFYLRCRSGQPTTSSVILTHYIFILQIYWHKQNIATVIFLRYWQYFLLQPMTSYASDISIHYYYDKTNNFYKRILQLWRVHVAT